MLIVIHRSIGFRDGLHCSLHSKGEITLQKGKILIQSKRPLHVFYLSNIRDAAIANDVLAEVSWKEGVGLIGEEDG
jgi:hypothetical protein